MEYKNLKNEGTIQEQVLICLKDRSQLSLLFLFIIYFKNLMFISPDYLTQCARIRVPVVSMKIEKFKDLFRAALDRWRIFSAILPILGKI